MDSFLKNLEWVAVTSATSDASPNRSAVKHVFTSIQYNSGSHHANNESCLCGVTERCIMLCVPLIQSSPKACGICSKSNPVLLWYSLRLLAKKAEYPLEEDPNRNVRSFVELSWYIHPLQSHHHLIEGIGLDRASGKIHRRNW